METMQREYNSYKRKIARYNREYKTIWPNSNDIKPVTFRHFVKTYFNAEFDNETWKEITQ